VIERCTSEKYQVNGVKEKYQVNGVKKEEK
jgi:hypothetical protein